MPATSGTYSGNESVIYNKIKSAGYNTAVACGILANLYAESGFNPANMQNSYEGTYNDTTYTSAVNDGSYTRDKFIKDSIGYGLAQWTYWSVKQDLYDYVVKKNRKSIGDLNSQISFLLAAIKGTYGSENYSSLRNSLSNIPNTADGAYQAGYDFCRLYEKPAAGQSAWESRGKNASTTFWKAYSGDTGESGDEGSSSEGSIVPVVDKGKSIVKIAKQQIGKPYLKGSNGPNAFDCSGLVYYCWNQAGISLADMTADSYYKHFKSKGKSITNTGDVAAADLLFYENNSSQSGLDHIAIANGSGGRIHAANSDRGVVEDHNLGNPTYIIRALSDSETSQEEGSSDSTGGSSSGGDTTSPTNRPATPEDRHASAMVENLSRVEAAGYDYGYLIDMDHGGEFRFYVPEFTETAGANWNPVELRGRSVTVLSYESTNSRSITISLDLYAGVGLYDGTTSGESGEELVSRLHSDLNFVKSLEYPDYTDSIARPPATVHLILGSSINLEGVVSNVEVEHLKPVDTQNRSLYVKLNFTVTQIAVNPPDWRDIQSGQYAILNTEDAGSRYVGLTNDDYAQSGGIIYPGGNTLYDR